MSEVMLPEPSQDQGDRYNNFSIELDCAPGGIRPNDLIGGVLTDTGLEVSDFDTAPPFFGHQTWRLKASAGKDELFTSIHNDIIKSRVEALYNEGFIRYGSW